MIDCVSSPRGDCGNHDEDNDYAAERGSDGNVF